MNTVQNLFLKKSLFLIISLLGLFFVNIVFTNSVLAQSSDDEKIATRLFAESKYKESILFLDKALVAHPKDSKLLYLRGRCLLETGMYNKGLDDFFTAVNLLPQESTYYFHMAICEWKLGRRKAAITNLEKSIEYDPNNFISDYMLGVIYLEMGTIQMSREHFDVAIDKSEKFGFKLSGDANPKYTDEYKCIMRIQQEQIKKFSKDATVFLYQGILKTMVKDNYSANTDYTKAIEYDPKLTLSYYYRGTTYLFIKKYELALKDLFTYSHFIPDDKHAQDMMEEIKSKMNAGIVYDTEKQEVFLFTEVMPQFPDGGDVAMKKFITSNLNVSGFKNTEVKGRVIVSFVVSKDGQVVDAKVEKGVIKEYDDEALRIIKMMPKWKPGLQNGKPAAVRITLPISFSFKE